MSKYIDVEVLKQQDFQDFSNTDVFNAIDNCPTIDVNNEIISAINKCGEDSDCNECICNMGDDCLLNHIE